MSKWLALVDDPTGSSNTPCDSVTNGDKTPETDAQGGFCQVLSRCHSRIEEKYAGAATRLPNDMRHGFAINGQPMTWTGNIVSLDAWRELSEWQKHGQNGRMWNGRTRKWEDVE